MGGGGGAQSEKERERERERGQRARKKERERMSTMKIGTLSECEQVTNIHIVRQLSSQ